VFAVLGLIEDKDDWEIQRDYTRSVSELITEAALVTIQACQSLEIIHLAGLSNLDPAGSTDIPSRAVDW
jgi:hypothetical protein